MTADRPRVVALIPARLASSRLPNKVLLPIAGWPMIRWVHAAAEAATRVEAVAIATASPEIERTAIGFGAQVIRTGAGHPTGTDRVAWAAEHIEGDIIVNVQADEPTLTGPVLDALVAAFDDPAVQIASLMTRARDAAELADPAAVKVVCAANGDALYFSRAAIPYGRFDGALAAARVHLGVYAFRRDALRRFAAAAPSPAEQIEGLEQLRALHHGWPIRMVEVDWRGVGVDTPDDLARARALLGATRQGS